MQTLFPTIRSSVFHVGLLLALSFLLASCSQSRSGIGKKKRSEIWGAQQVCDNVPDYEVMGCFSVEPNIGANQANISVIDLGIDPLDIPYRVLARRPEDIAFTVLADNVMADIGRSFVVQAGAKHYIEGYEEWRFETTRKAGTGNFGLVDVNAGKGLPLAQVRIYWPELLQPAPK